MMFNELPKRIKKTFVEAMVARVGARTTRNGSFITVVTTKGKRYKYVKVESTYLPYAESKARSFKDDSEMVPAVEMPSSAELGYADDDAVTRDPVLCGA